jgi:WD40 repeat protein
LAWPRTFGGDRPELRSTIKALGQAQRLQRETIPALRHGHAVLGAAFNGDESRILTWSDDGTARLWDIPRLPHGHLIDVACGMLPDHDTSELEDRYGIAITEPICGPDTPAPVWTEFVD